MRPEGQPAYHGWERCPRSLACGRYNSERSAVPTFFPRQTIQWRVEEPPAFRRLSLSLVEMAMITGILLRLFRAVALTHGSNSGLYLGGTFLVALLVMLGMETAHLANFPLHRWTWRAPAFALLETGGEMLTSLVLIWLRREPMGTARADFHDWPGMAGQALLARGLIIVLWALLLAGVITLVRRTMGREEDADEEPVTAGIGS
ncbi:MAG: hypothetical protein JWO05_1499 [Gemmatimonadetes bacterium]|nr:hypothetical protein [Gemmatimonadota bacterium]